MKSFIAYKFTWANCSSSYIGETCCYFKIRIEEHVKKDKQSHIFKYIHSITPEFDSYDSLSFIIIVKANFKFDLKIKEPLHINWRKSNLNAQQNHVALTLSLGLASLLYPSLTLFFAFLFYLLFSLSLTLIIGIFYFFNYTSLLLHLIITNLVNIFYNKYVINICPRHLL